MQRPPPGYMIDGRLEFHLSGVPASLDQLPVVSIIPTAHTLRVGVNLVDAAATSHLWRSYLQPKD